MQTSSTTTLERRVTFCRQLTTHPFEAGWATEARFFVQLRDNTTDVMVQAQISPDGLNWLNFGESVTHKAGETISTVGLTNFGSWLRAVLVQAEPHQDVEALVHLTLKG